MPRFASFDGTQIAYEKEGTGYPTLLVHGFVADSFAQWILPGLSEKLARAGRLVVMPDLRGHGMSAKPHEPEAYAGDTLGRDVLALLDHLEIERCDVMGYSMGAGLTLRLLVEHPARFRSAVVSGIGSAYAPGGRYVDPGQAAPRQSFLVEGLLAEDKSTVTNPVARSFRDFADVVRADRKALAALQTAPGRQGPVGDIGSIAVPVLVLAAENDPLAADPQALADAIPGARCTLVPGTHLNVVNNPAYQDAVLSFFAQVG